MEMLAAVDNATEIPRKVKPVRELSRRVRLLRLRVEAETRDSSECAFVGCQNKESCGTVACPFRNGAFVDINKKWIFSKQPPVLQSHRGKAFLS